MERRRWPGFGDWYCYEFCDLLFGFFLFIFAVLFCLVLFFIRCLPLKVIGTTSPTTWKPNTKDLLTLLMKSKADFTVKRYTKEIVKFSRWCNLSSIQPTPPFSVSIVIVYLHKVYVSSKSLMQCNRWLMQPLNGFIPLFPASLAILWMLQFVIIC